MRRFLARIPVLCTGVVACGDAPESAPTPPDGITVEASPATQAEIGVVTWSVDPTDLEASVKGYDASEQVTVELSHTETIKDASHSENEYVLRQGTESARLVLDVGKGGALTIVESTFTGKYMRTAQLIAGDLSSGKVKSTSGATDPILKAPSGAVSAQTLKPQDSLVQVCPDLLRKCYAPVLIYKTAIALVDANCPPQKRYDACGWDGADFFAPTLQNPSPGAEQRCLDNMKKNCGIGLRSQLEKKNDAVACERDPQFQPCLKKTYGMDDVSAPPGGSGEVRFIGQ
jgi:hypothetical protein